MAGEHSESGTPSTNGVSSSRVSPQAADRAAFLSGLDDAGDKGELADDDSAGDDDSDLDEALDESGEDETDADEVDADADAEDPDADLDDDDDDQKDEDKDDPDAKKGIDKVRRTEKRMREQLKKERADAEAELAQRAKQVELELEQKWGKRIEAAERFEKLSARVNIDPLGVLQALGLREESYEQVAQVMYTLAKAKDDPKARAAAAALMKERERDDELAELKKWREESDKTAKDRAAAAAEEKKWDAYFDRVTKAVSDKTPLAKAWLKANPDAARERMHVVTAKLAREAGGKIPAERDVMVALEKDRRRTLRELGIDPKTKTAIAASGSVAAGTKPKAPKKGERPAPPKDEAKTEKRSAREDFINGTKFD